MKMGMLWVCFTANIQHVKKNLLCWHIAPVFHAIIIFILSFQLENCLNDAAFHSSIDNLMFTLKPQA